MKNCLEKYVFKRGDPFIWPLWLHDAHPDLDLPPDDPARGIALDSNVQIECQINDQHGRFIATLEYEPYVDQVADTGWLLLKSDDTSDWPKGWAVTDIKVIIDGAQKHSMDFEFEILGAQTP